MILFRMGRSICPGLIDGGLNIIDTLETTRIRPVKPPKSSNLVVVNIDEWSPCTHAHTHKLLYGWWLRREIKIRRVVKRHCCSGGLSQLTVLRTLHRGACCFTQCRCKRNSWIIPLISKEDNKRDAARSKVWLFSGRWICNDICLHQCLLKVLV